MNMRKPKVSKNIIVFLWLGMIPLDSFSAFGVGARSAFGDNARLAFAVDARQQADASRKKDAELLARAIDYFTSQKYHECLVILQPLSQRYKLNPRYKAYLGVCHYYEWEYEEAIRCLDEAIPRLEGFSPSERSLYYWMDAESHFSLQRYREAMPLYVQMLQLCHDAEKPDAYYRLGFCHLFLAEKDKARECFEQALLGYQTYRNRPDDKARMAQIKHMIQGLKEK